jgi:D-amino peptidase
MRLLPAFLLLAAATSAAAQPVPRFAEKRIPAEPGFRLYLIADMEGMGGAVLGTEVIGGTEGAAYRDRGGRDYWEHYRGLLTEEVNAVIRGARAGGARSFVVNEGHGGNRFANVLPWALDTAAILIRGYPKPMVMSTGIDSSFGTVIFTGAHAGAGRPGVMAHTYAFSDFRVNGTWLNEVGINALVAGEQGVSVSVVSGDDQLVRESLELLGNGAIGVVTKVAVGGNAAITHSPARVRGMLEAAAREAVERERRGDFRPFTLARPYAVEFTLRRSYPDEMVAGVDSLATEWKLEKTGDRSYRFASDSAARIAWLLDAIERVVLP